MTSQDATAPPLPESEPLPRVVDPGPADSKPEIPEGSRSVSPAQLAEMYEIESERSAVLMEQIARLSAEIAHMRVLLKKAQSASAESDSL